MLNMVVWTIEGASITATIKYIYMTNKQLHGLIHGFFSFNFLAYDVLMKERANIGLFLMNRGIRCQAQRLDPNTRRLEGGVTSSLLFFAWDIHVKTYRSLHFPPSLNRVFSIVVVAPNRERFAWMKHPR